MDSINTPYKCIVIEDMTPQREKVEKWINEDGRLLCLNGSDKLEDGLELINQNTVDILFLDDHLPASEEYAHSIDYMRNISKENMIRFENKIIIFITTDDKQKFDLYTFLQRRYRNIFIDYLKKGNYSKEDLKFAISNAIITLNNLHSNLTLKQKEIINITDEKSKRILAIDVDDIIFVQSVSETFGQSRITRYHLNYRNKEGIDEKIEISRNLDYFIEEFKNYFVRISKSHVISKNENYFKGISKNKSEIYLHELTKIDSLTYTTIKVGDISEYKTNLIEYLKLQHIVFEKKESQTTK